MSERQSERDSGLNSAFNLWMMQNLMRGGNHDSDQFARRPERNTDESSEADLDIDVGGSLDNRTSDELPPVAAAPKMQLGARPLIREQRPDSDQAIPMADDGYDNEADQQMQSGDRSDVGSFFDKIGGPGGWGGLEDEESSAKKKSVWSSIGGGIKRFAKGLGGVVKNLSGYNLIRHGLIGANWNRGQMKRSQRKYDETTDALKAHNDPANADRLVQELGQDGYKQRLDQLNGSLQKYDDSLYNARYGLLTNRMNYSGYYMANNFKRAFSDGNISPKREGLRQFLTAGLRRQVVIPPPLSEKK